MTHKQWDKASRGQSNRSIEETISSNYIQGREHLKGDKDLKAWICWVIVCVLCWLFAYAFPLRSQPEFLAVECHVTNRYLENLFWVAKATEVCCVDCCNIGDCNGLHRVIWSRTKASPRAAASFTRFSWFVRIIIHLHDMERMVGATQPSRPPASPH